MLVPLLISLVAGAVTVFGFAPFGLPGLPLLTLATLFHLWAEAATPRAAGRIGFAFGLGLFGAGASWVAIALYRFGGMALPLAGVATLGFVAYLALFPAVAGWSAKRLANWSGAPLLLLAASAWTLSEWARSWLLSGFPWLSIGHSQIPDSPLAGYAPLAGTFGVTLATAATAAAAASLVRPAPADAARFGRRAALVAVAAGLIVGGGAALSTIDWTRPAGPPLTVSLLQGNVEQGIKFDPAARAATLALYRDLVDRAEGRLVVLPESALPMFAHEIPEPFTEALRERALRGEGSVLFGVFVFSPRNGGEYYNSVVALDASRTQIYRKHHLVPFGETIPLKSVFGWIINEILHIPLADQTPGPADQPPLSAAGQKIAISICYEDAFGAEVIRQLPEATLLVNVSNDAWYGRSIAAEQHHQIAQARARETGRYMLRVTQTGITAVIDEHGKERRRLPWFSLGVLEDRVVGREGATLYVRVGDWAAVGAAVLVLAGAGFAWRGRRTRGRFGKRAPSVQSRT